MNISIAMCTFNGSRFLEEQLQSIRAQTMQPFELVVCDDASTDDTEADETKAILERFAGVVSFPVRFYKNDTNLGSTKNFEQAIRLCRGEAIALCDQDDRWMPEKLATIDAILTSRPELAGVFSNAALIDEGGKPLPGDLWSRSGFTRQKQKAFSRSEAPYQLVGRDTVTGACLVFRSEYVPRIVPIPGEWFHDGWIALVLAGVAEVEALPSRLIAYRLHSRQLVGARKVPWRTRIAAPRDLAIAAHHKVARRFELIADKLTALSADPAIVFYARRKVRFLEERAMELSQPRAARIMPALRRLPDYFEFEKGLLSLVRDLSH